MIPHQSHARPAAILALRLSEKIGAGPPGSVKYPEKYVVKRRLIPRR
jgi:hypothetical protein